jgi:hypothetical protein
MICRFILLILKDPVNLSSITRIEIHILVDSISTLLLILSKARNFASKFVVTSR